MDINLWISILFAIPLAIVANIFTPKVQSWLESRGKKRSKARVTQLKTELEQLKYYKANPELFTQYLLGVVIKTTFVGSIIGIIAALAYMITRVAKDFFYVYDYLYIDVLEVVLQFSSQIVSMFGAVIIINICGNALRVMHSMKNYIAVSEQLECQITESENEC
ncbi:hypothetical protein L5176_004434 [Vibrio parahaemolyticus]|nr:hypothetical protein [Vibrio parahaemolyticus]MBM4846593.1 hypothetical protein [Vibrio parahaemolyticus]